MDSPITPREHEEFRNTVLAEFKRLDAEDVRLNKRLTNVEENTKQLTALTITVQKLADNIEQMCKTQEQEGKRLTELEGRDGEMWRKVIGYVITAIIGIVVGFIFTQIGM